MSTCRAATISITPRLPLPPRMWSASTKRTTVSALGQFECGFGRAEQFRLGQAQARMMLVKTRPATIRSSTSSRTTSAAASSPSCSTTASRTARTSAGIWDVDFEALAAQQGRFTRIFVSGVRADDMALRLKYAGFPAERIELVRDYEKLLGDDRRGRGAGLHHADLHRHVDLRARSANIPTSRRSTNKEERKNGTQYLPSVPGHP